MNILKPGRTTSRLFFQLFPRNMEVGESDGQLADRSVPLGRHTVYVWTSADCPFKHDGRTSGIRRVLQLHPGRCGGFTAVDGLLVSSQARTHAYDS
jgi:hypothetical protein